MTNETVPAREKRMARDYFFPTPVYYTDLARAEDLNVRLVKDIRAWRERDPGGTSGRTCRSRYNGTGTGYHDEATPG